MQLGQQGMERSIDISLDALEQGGGQQLRISHDQSFGIRQ